MSLRTGRFDGRKASRRLEDLISTIAPVMVASKTAEGLMCASKLAVVPYEDGHVSIRRQGDGSATLTEHYFGGGKKISHQQIESGKLVVPLRERAENCAIVEWIEVNIPKV